MTPPFSLPQLSHGIDPSPPTLELACAQLAKLKANICELSRFERDQERAARDKVVEQRKKDAAAAAAADRTPAKPANAFLQYKAMTGQARTDFFRANEQAIWDAHRATNTSKTK